MTVLCKNKDDIQNCNNYWGIKLLRHYMKVRKRVVDVRVRSIMSFLRINSHSCSDDTGQRALEVMMKAKT